MPDARPSLLEAFEATQPQKRVCSMGKIIEQLDAEDKDRLAVWMDDESMSGERIVSLLKYCGLTIARSTVVSHRRHECRCCR